MKDRLIKMTKARWWHRSSLGCLALESKAFWGYDAGFLQACVDDLKVPWRTMLFGDVFIAAAGGCWRGFYALEYADDQAELTHLFVHPQHIGQGVGTILWLHAVARVRTRMLRTCSETTLNIHSDPHARGFYERMGAVFAGEAASAVKPGRKLPYLKYQVAGGQ